MTKTRWIATAIGLGALCASGQAQYAIRLAPKTKVPAIAITTGTSTGGFLGGADDCNSAHPSLGPGDVPSEPFTNGTTGTTGQNEAICFFFGTSGITNDVWYDWTADQNANATLETCGQTAVDTKVAIWPGTAGCPAAGTAIACSDDACSLQSGVTWSVTSGTTYTIQLGTFPGAAGGSGTFDITQFLPPPPPPCGAKDDGTTENALGLTAGGELGWIKTMDCLMEHNAVSTAYGTAMFPGSVTNGNPGQIVVYTNPTGLLDPNDPNWVTETKLNVVVVNGDMDILNPYTYPTLNIPAGSSTMVLASAIHSSAGPGMMEFPGPIDQTGGNNPNAWWVGASGSGATLNTTTLAANSTPPQTLSSTGISGTWLLRIDDSGGVPSPGTPVCFGDGSGAACGCGNEAPAGSGSGCLNSLNVGAALAAFGTASTTAANLTLQASGVRTQPGLFFQGVNTIAGGSGQTFGDGIRCCGGSVVRVSMEDPPPPQPATTATTITTNSLPAGGMGQPLTTGINPGDKRCYQYWYRDPGVVNPCNAMLFNLSNAVTVTWGA